MLMQTDPFRELDRLAQQVLGTAARPAAMPMDAWREDQAFMVAFDLLRSGRAGYSAAN
jgi:HSP20 family protein